VAKKNLRQRALAMERFNLDAYQVQMILDLKISFDSLAKRKAKAWDNNRWTLAEYIEYRYKQEFGKSRPEKEAFVPLRPKLEKMKRINGANRPASAHPFYEQKAMVMRQAREQAGLTVLELAKKTNLRPEIIETLEDPDSRKAVSFETIAEIATALGLELRVDVRLEELAKGAGERQV
jgi:ribosome-binding protein aMBF1 (putative translation factor)